MKRSTICPHVRKEQSIVRARSRRKLLYSVMNPNVYVLGDAVNRNPFGISVCFPGPKNPYSIFHVRISISAFALCVNTPRRCSLFVKQINPISTVVGVHLSRVA